jgi:hypothetical protein
MSVFRAKKKGEPIRLSPPYTALRLLVIGYQSGSAAKAEVRALQRTFAPARANGRTARKTTTWTGFFQQNE